MTDLLREYWDWFLLDTLLWTGGLIALVLLLRRPVSRYLGAGSAYALWALPALRLLFPPIQLPAWMAPVPAMPADAEIAPAIAAELDPGFVAMAQMPAPPLPEPTDFVTPLALIWLAGAVFFLARRFWLYGELRRELLEDAVPVGESGRVRLVETPAISGPMAFGVIDKVIALPVGFMTSRNRQARDLAIAHELEHHRGHDLLANIMVQPLFAAHWFNPLGWMGWTALRRDQEAWCDARVVASRPREERVVYASVIADFARRPQVAPRPALAAPMACPVLGDKSIIHRLRNLSMTDVSKRRRIAGRAGLAAALFALPMTASICYASAAAPVPPEAPVAPLAPLPPLAPEAPVAPEAPEPPEVADIDREMADLEREMADIDRELANMDREIDRSWTDKDGKKHRVVVRERTETRGDSAAPADKRVVRRYRRDMTDEERAELERDLAEMRADLAESRAELASEMAEATREIQIAFAEARAESAEARANAPRVKISCKDKVSIVTSGKDETGRETLFVCEANADRLAVEAMKSARKAIKADRNLSDEERAEALRALDEEIRNHSR
ncbi:MAG: M56 family metallopeptidase [Erythrobacter sp.]